MNREHITMKTKMVLGIESKAIDTSQYLGTAYNCHL